MPDLPKGPNCIVIYVELSNHVALGPNDKMSDILVVDDEIGIREILNETLSDEGYGVLLAKDAAAARELIKKKPDLVLLDIWMPDTDGISLLKEWTATGSFSIPVITMSGHATLDIAVEAAKIGAVACLEKPFSVKRLLESVKAALEAASSEPKIGEKQLNPMRRGTVNGATDFQHGHTAPLAAGAPRAFNAPSTDDSGENFFEDVDFDAPLRDARDQFERKYFKRLLVREKYSMTRVAFHAGLERTHLYRKLKNLGLEIGKGGKAKDEIFPEE